MTRGGFGHLLARRAFASSQRLGEAEFVTIWIGHVEEPLAPFGVARRRIRAVAGCDDAGVQRIHVGMVEDDAPPPRPCSLGGLGDQIEIADRKSTRLNSSHITIS